MKDDQKPQTAEEIHKDILNDNRLSQKLMKSNKGANLINTKDSYKKKYYINILLEIEINLLKTTSTVIVKSNLPFADWRYDHKEINPQLFLQQFKEWASRPLFIPRHFNRKNRYFNDDRKMSDWDSPFQRKQNIPFEEIEIMIYPEAQKHIKNALSTTPQRIISQIKEICESQRLANKEEAKDFDRFVALVEQSKDLKDQVPDDKHYGYGYEKDQTLKITITKKEFNQRQHKIENELLKLANKYPFLTLPELGYYHLIKKIPEGKWIKQNRKELKNQYDQGDNEIEFKEFCQDAYLQWAEENDFE